MQKCFEQKNIDMDSILFKKCVDCKAYDADKMKFYSLLKHNNETRISP